MSAGPGPGSAIAAGDAQRLGYRGFGSFFNDEDVEVLVRRPAAEYQPPPVPFDDPLDEAFGGGGAAAVAAAAAEQELGAPLRRLFLVDLEEFVFVNHGAFGATAAPVQRAADLWRARCERQPLRFLDRELLPHLVRVLRDVAEFVGCRAADLALMPNATAALNTVFANVRLAAGDAVFVLDVGYGSVKEMARAAAAAAGARVVEAAVPLPLGADGADAIVRLVGESLPDRCRLAVFDAVTSNTALRLPLERLIALCRARGVPVLVDGAHAPLQLPLRLDALGADFFAGNLHKWACGARGSALLWVAPGRQDGFRPLVRSHGAGRGFTSDFIWDGCRDYAPLLAAPTALRLWRLLGADRVRRYMRELLAGAAELLTRAWGTELLAPLSLSAPSMALVALPGGFEAEAGAATSADAKHVQDGLFAGRIECPVKCVRGRLYARVSAAPYNELRDYERLAAAVLALLPRPGGGPSG